jgi:hypothetical protein
VIIADQQQPDRPVLPAHVFQAGLVIVDTVVSGSGPLPREFKFNFRENAAGYPEFVSVECAMPINCGDAVDKLNAAIGVGTSDAEIQARREAILAVLPDNYGADDIERIRAYSGNGRERLNADLKNLPVSTTREVSALVTCDRALGSGEAWHCEYRFMTYNQTLPDGRTVSVRSLDLDESQVEAMVASLGDDAGFTRMASLSPRDGGYVLNTLGPDITRITAYFDDNLNLTEKLYRER